MTKTYVPISAPGVTPLLYVYDRENKLLFDPFSFTAKVQGLQYSSVVPGGYETCSFTIPLVVGKELMTRAAYRVAIRCGFRTAWEGRIADLSRRTAGGGEMNITALGGWEHLKQRYVTDAAEDGETGKTLIESILMDMPLISTDSTDIGDPGFDLTDQSWTRKTPQKIISDIAKLGDDQTPPRNWYFNVWGTDDTPTDGSYDNVVQTSARDAYSTSDEATYSHTATTLRFGAYGTTYAYDSGIIFPALGLPRYTTILTAHLHMRTAGTMGGSAYIAHMQIHCERSGAPADFADGNRPTDRTLTNAYVDWQPLATEWPSGAGDNVLVTTPDFADVVQEAVNLSTFSSDSGINVVVKGLMWAADDSRKQARAYDDAASAAASLHITYGTPDATTMAFHAEFVPQQGTAASDVDYLIHADDVEGGFEVTPSLETMHNYVIAKGGSTYSTAAEDATSQDLYDRRENDPEELDAGTTAGSAQIANLRDTYLEAHKDPIWKANDITVKRLYNRWGWPVNPAVVRAGCVIKLCDFPTFETDTERAYFVVKTRYMAETGALTLSPSLQQDTLEIQLLRVKQEGQD
jgi:hypothetical protein